ncbi:polysaccharide deacetylase [Clostridiales bacterium oral taxon 876 str. F0540]|nr:polysaccharide deacetylase [Clostridiales bacterium oral taxon 876 str. F0540]
MVKHKQYFFIILFVLINLLTLSGCNNKEQIQLLSNKAAELEKNKKDLSSEITELKKINEQLSSEINQLKVINEKLTESNNALQKQNADLINKQSSSNSIADKTAYLTFDDGPSDNTIKILNILKENNIKATFFVNGRPERKEIYQRIINEGHTIGNHTYSHDYSIIYKAIESFDKDKQKLDDLIVGITGKKPDILRFPGGSNNHVSFSYGGPDFMDKLTKHIKQSGIKYFDWNVDSTDAEVITQDKDKIITEVLKGCKNKKQAIILMHDSSPKITTVQALPDIIKGLKLQGYKFSALSAEVGAVQFK